MKSVFLILFLLLIILSYNSSAQKRQPQSVLWKIQSPQTHKTSYLLGSIHFFGKEWVESYPRLDSIVKVSEVFLCEITGQPFPKTRQKLLDKPIQHLKAKDLFGGNFGKVNDYFVKETGSGLIENIDDSNEDAASVLKRMFDFLMDKQMEGTGLKVSPLGMDEVLLGMATTQNKTTVQLDDPAIVNPIITDLFGTKDAANAISDLVDELESKTQQPTNAPDSGSMLYNNGKHIYNFSATGKGGEKLAKAITRNNLWMKRIPGYLNKNKAFIVVGIGHLDGKDGLLMQLKKRGYNVAPVNLP